MWSGERLTKVQTTTRPDHVWPEVGTKIGKADQNRERQEWKNEKPKLDNDRRPTGIYFIDFDDQGYKETLQNARWKLESLIEAAMRIKSDVLTSNRKLAAEVNSIPQGSEYHPWWNLKNPQDNEWNLLYHKKHNDHIAGKGFTSMTHYNLVHKFIPVPQAVKNPDAKAAVDKEWK